MPRMARPCSSRCGGGGVVLVELVGDPPVQHIQQLEHRLHAQLRILLSATATTATCTRFVGGVRGTSLVRAAQYRQ